MTGTKIIDIGDQTDILADIQRGRLKHADEVMGKQSLQLEQWKAVGEYDRDAGRHHAFVSTGKGVVVDLATIPKAERIRIEESYQCSREEVKKHTVWANSRGDYGLHLVAKPFFSFPIKPEEYAAKPIPSLAEWQELWAVWDAVTLKMIPEEELLSQPIKLRNACIFYLGHIPTFLDIHLARATDGNASEPTNFWSIFERGIDPDVDDPTKCHAHSAVPEEWPELGVVLEHQKNVRDRATALYRSGEAESNGRVSRAMWLAFEHEAMHLETLLYMLIQSEKVLPPPGTVTPDFSALAKQSESLAVENEWFTIPDTNFDMGILDDDKDYKTNRYFGWDNEKPQRSAHVQSFRAKARPISNGEYAMYLEKTGKTAIPASWCAESSPTQDAYTSKRDSVVKGDSSGTEGLNQDATTERYVRTVFGNVPLKYALGWPVVASYDELAGCAQWMGGRIPTMEEARSIYNYVDSMKMEFQQRRGNNIPAVNGHLINNGVDETPPCKPVSDGHSRTPASLRPGDLFVDLEGANVAFRHWHPVSVVESGDRLCGQADLGGVWEWTSSVLEKHDGFEPMELYPGYTADFFDGKHNITLGGSWATHPRIAGRKTFVNWYQRNYPYVWAGARIVGDV